MSTPSKERRKRRAWMQKERAEHERRVKYLENVHRENIKSLRNELTRMIPRDDEGVYYPSGKVEAPHIVIPARIEMWHDGGLPPPFMREASYYVRPEMFHLYAKQFALRLPDGQTVVWFGWELGR